MSLGAAGVGEDEERRQKEIAKDEEQREKDEIRLADASETIPHEKLGQWSVGSIRIVEDVSFRGGRADALLLFEAAHGEWVKKGKKGGIRHKAIVQPIVNFPANFPAYLKLALPLYEDGTHLMYESPLMKFTLTVATAMAGGKVDRGERYYVRSQGS